MTVGWLTWRRVAVSVLMRCSMDVWADGRWVFIHVLDVQDGMHDVSSEQATGA